MDMIVIIAQKCLWSGLTGFNGLGFLGSGLDARKCKPSWSTAAVLTVTER